MSLFYVPSSVLKTGDIFGGGGGRALCLHETLVLLEEIRNKCTQEYMV